MDKECTTEKKITLEAIDEALELLKNGPTKEQQAWNDGYMCSMNRVAHLISHCNKIINRWDELKKVLKEKRENRKYAGDVERLTAYDYILGIMESMEKGEYENI